MSDEHELVEALKRMRYDLTALQAKVSDMLVLVGRLNLAPLERHPCSCGLTFSSEAKFAEHRYQSHDGPQPAHWLDAEERADDPAPSDIDEDELPVEPRFHAPEGVAT